uniref:cytochrome c biogenesis protein transmembrane region n=1 Tax=Erythrolobus coxiae TaxID=362235 RepID=UPI001FCE1594|nr:cytochrome c biogenesis protein transmembrane region [Erythrolobus coxiae]UNJ17651.1 cytochrome c biogenesis protein transmembrane region [Erythrolobus coxiae]
MFFFIQHLQALLNFQYFNQITFTSIVIVFIAGIISGMNPCVISVLPVYMKYLDNNKKQFNIINIINTFNFSLGIATSITTIGIFSVIIKASSVQYLRYSTKISGLIIFIMGLITMEILQINFTPTNYKKLLRNTKFFVSSYLNGLIFGLTLSTCSTPTLVGIILWISNTNSITKGILFICIYSIGYVIPIGILSFTLVKIKSKINQYIFSEWVPIINGAFLIIIGTTYIYS